MEQPHKVGDEADEAHHRKHAKSETQSSGPQIENTTASAPQMSETLPAKAAWPASFRRLG